ncbi:MAG TPA: ABC transporter substrate-binding protein, partial [Rubellimicrobium sp.]|nr:ABC transporter substrate-binding protein [Rubellimicrobium sp.]
MNNFARTAGLSAALASLIASAAAAQDGKTVIAVSIPAATHGWTGGVVYHAEQAEQEIEAAFPEIDVVVKTSPSATAQVSALEDLTASQDIAALVILPFTSEELTGPVEQVKAGGTFITVVDRGLTDPSIQDLYVAGNNI